MNLKEIICYSISTLSFVGLGFAFFTVTPSTASFFYGSIGFITANFVLSLKVGKFLSE